MNKKQQKLYVIIPLIYVIFIIVFFLFHFLGKDPFESDAIGYLTISGARSRAGLFSQKKITHLQAECGGFQLEFAGSSPVVLVYEDGRRESCEVEAYTIFETNVDIKYTNGLIIALRVTGEGGGKSEVFIKKLPGKRSGVNILLRFRVRGTNIQRPGEIPLISSFYSFEQFFLSLSHRSRIDHYNHLLVLKGEDDFSTPVITIEKNEKEGRDPYLFWFLTKTFPMTGETYEQKREEYLSLSFTHWLSGRFDKEESQWVDKDNFLSFDEGIIKGMFAESFRRLSFVDTADWRREYRQVLSITDDAMSEEKRKRRDEDSGDRDRPGTPFPFLSSPFLGDLEEAVETLQKDDIQLLKKVEALILEEDPAVFLIPHLFLVLLDRGNIAQFDELVSRIVNKVDPDTVDISVCLGMVDMYFDAVLWLKAKEPYFERFKDLLLTHVIPNLKQTENGLFLTEKDNNVSSIPLSMKAGFLLQKATEVTGNQDFAELGRKCIFSALSLADEQGFLPEEIVIQGFDRLIPVGSLGLEEVYDFVVPRGFIPREIPLFPELKPGMWIWTAAREILPRRKAGELSITFSFPEGYSHYYFIQGIPPVSTLFFHNREVDENPDYDDARQGWYYDEAIQTLYVKLYHRDEDETVLIEYE